MLKHDYDCRGPCPKASMGAGAVTDRTAGPAGLNGTEIATGRAGDWGTERERESRGQTPDASQPASQSTQLASLALTHRRPVLGWRFFFPPHRWPQLPIVARVPSTPPHPPSPPITRASNAQTNKRHEGSRPRATVVRCGGGSEREGEHRVRHTGGVVGGGRGPGPGERTRRASQRRAPARVRPSLGLCAMRAKLDRRSIRARICSGMVGGGGAGRSSKPSINVPWPERGRWTSRRSVSTSTSSIWGD